MPPQKNTDGPKPAAKGEHNPAVNDLLAYAQGLKAEREALQVQTSANREVLRNYAKMGLCSDEQADAIEEFYPKPKRGEKTEPTDTTAPAAA